MRVLILIFLIVGLSGCATNPYQKIGSGGMIGGYDETMIHPGQYRVTFQGQGGGANEVNVYASFLRRCADLAKSNGAPYFKVIDGHSGEMHQGGVSIPNYSGTMIMLSAKENDSWSSSEVLAKYDAAKN